MTADQESQEPQPGVGGAAVPLTTGPIEANGPVEANVPAEAGNAPAPHATTESADSVRPSDRIRIGSQRPEERTDVLQAQSPLAGGTASSPATDAVSSVPASPKGPPALGATHVYPPPNIRDRLSPELQQEYEAALAGSSLDELIESAAASAPTELAPETRVSATVVSRHGDDIFVDLGGSNQGVIANKQFETPPEIGAQLELIVSRFDADQGLYEMSLSTAAVDVGRWEDVVPGQIVEVTIVGSNKGGLECQVAGIRGFIPMGQISIFRVESPEEYVGQRLACVVTEANRGRKNLVLSHRALMERERKENREKLLAEIAPGQVRDGVVRSLQAFGAFVDLGGVDGMIHVSQLSWDRIGHPSETLQVGQAIKVRVEKINRETGKISLAYRELGENPWNQVESRFAPGSTVKGNVSKLMQFGAFVRLSAGVEGLIHISELGHGRVHRVSDVLSEGQEVEVKVLNVDTQAQRISLSLKALLPPPEKPADKRDQLPEGPLATPKDAPRPDRRRKHDENLKGGVGQPTGGEKFGLRW